jgi:hypothetical protein
MTGPLDEVIRQLKAAIEKLDTAAITATRAQADALQAHTHYTDAGRGSNHPAIQAAQTESTTAAAKAGKVGRLLAETSTHLTTYVNTIAPGTIPTGQSTETTLPTGEQLVATAPSKGGKAEAFLRRYVKKADDTEDNLHEAENAVTTGVREIFQGAKDGPGSSGNVTSTGQPTVATPVERPQLEHPVTAVIMAAGAVVVGVRGLSNLIKKHREEKNDGDQP